MGCRCFPKFSSCAREKIPLLEPECQWSVLKDYDVHRVQTLESFEDLDSLSLNVWLTKFVQEVANKKGGGYPLRSLC